MIEFVESCARFFETIGDRVLRKRRIVFLAGKAFFLRCRDENSFRELCLSYFAVASPLNRGLLVLLYDFFVSWQRILLVCRASDGRQSALAAI
jgi:hypothetical protein